MPFSIPFGIDKFERNGGKFFKLGANGGKCVSGIWKKILIGGIFF